MRASRFEAKAAVSNWPRKRAGRDWLLGAWWVSYRTIVHLEQRGLLCRCQVGINVACYTHGSVQALFGDPSIREPDRK
jgi:hypothetical protein